MSAKRQGLQLYGRLASRYVDDFDRRWIGEPARRSQGLPEVDDRVAGGREVEDERGSLLGSADIQSLADLEGAFAVIRQTRSFVFSRQTVTQLLAATALPFAPLLLTMVPLEELLDRLVGIVL